MSMRPDEVRKQEVPDEQSRSSGATKSRLPAESFATLLGPWAGMQGQSQGGACAPASIAMPPCAPGPASTPSLLAAFATRTIGAQGALASRPVRSDPLDPVTRHSAQISPLLGMSESPRVQALPDAPVQASARASLEEVLPALVRRIAWSGDGKRGTLRLEFGEGALAGGTLLVHADDGRVRVELQAPPGTDTTAWKERIASRLTKRGVNLDELVVE